MNLSLLNQSILSIRHYSQLKPITCSVVSGSTNSFFTVKMVDPVNFEDSIFKGDPILFGSLQENDTVNVSGGNVIAFVEAENNIIITPDKVFDGLERRQHERFPVSLCGSLVCHDSGKKRAHVYIKDMSYSGFRIYSDADLNEGTSVDIDVFLHNNMLNISGIIMRKSIFYGRNEYGIQIVFRDKNAIYATQDFLDKLLNSEKELIKKQLIKSTISTQSK